MKKHLLLLAAVAVAFSAAAADIANELPSVASQRLALSARKVMKLNESQSSGNWLPGSVTEYWWYGSQWSDPTKTSYTYLPDGKVDTETQGNEVSTYSYDSEGRVGSIVRKSTIANENYTTTETYTYDSVITNLVVRTEEVTTGDFNYKSVFGKEIVRNADGNITEVADYYQFESDPKEYEDKLVISYGSDGKASKIESYSYDDGKPSLELTLSNITWENTNGQILSDEIDDYNAELFFGDNRIKSADISYYEWPHPATISVTYSADGYSALVMMDAIKLFSSDYKSLDSYGSFECTAYEMDYDYDEDTGTFTQDYGLTEERMERYDAYGLEIESQLTTNYDDPQEHSTVEATKANVTYDETYGYPLEYILTEKPSYSDTYTNRERKVFEDYQQFTSIVTPVVNATPDAPVEYYNLQGQRVANPANGLYILRQGNSATKVIVR